MAFYDYVRATGDIDLWIRHAEKNADRAISALTKFGAPLFDLTISDLATPNMVFQIGLPPSRIDIVTSIYGVKFDEAWNAREFHEFGDLKGIPILSMALLIKNKSTTGRPKDNADVIWMTSENK